MPTVRPDGSSPPLGGVTLSMLALELAHLGELAHFPPVGVLAELVREAAGAGGGLSEQDTRRIRAWSARWRGTRKEIRGFYAARCLDDEIVAGCLVRLLDGGPEPAPQARAHLVGLYSADHGHAPEFPLWWRVTL